MKRELPTDDDAQFLLNASKQEVEEWNQHVFDIALENNDSYQYQGTFAPSRHEGMEGTILVTHDQLNWKAQDVMSRKARNEPVIPIYSFPPDEHGYQRHLLTEGDAEADRLGYICSNCLQWQESAITLECKWEHNGHTCGYVRRTNEERAADLRRFHQ